MDQELLDIMNERPVRIKPPIFLSNFKTEPIVHFNKKNDLITKLPFFMNAFKAMGYAHDYGNYKYHPYSWQNTPEISFSSVESSIGSIQNHFLLHKTGEFYDYESGISHLGHMCCRCQMTLVPYYRNIRPDYFKRELRFRRNKLNSVLQEYGLPLIDDKLLTDQLTPEIIISALKYDPIKFNLETDEAFLMINHLILDIMKDIKQEYEQKDIWNHVYRIDMLFWAVCIVYNDFLKTNNFMIDIPNGLFEKRSNETIKDRD